MWITVTSIKSSMLPDTDIETHDEYFTGMDDHPEECSVCRNAFDQENCRPRSLPCSHSFCSLCIANIMDDRQLSCPTCRSRHFATSVNQFPVNYSLEALLKKLKSLRVNHEPSSLSLSLLPMGLEERLEESSSKNGIDRLDLLLREQINRVQKLPSMYSDMLEKITSCKTRIHALMRDHEHLLERLDHLLEGHEKRNQCLEDLAKENKAMLVLLKGRWERLLSLIQDRDENCRNLEDTVKNLVTSTGPTQHEGTAVSIAECDRCICMKNVWLEKCKVEISQSLTLQVSEKLLARTRDALQVTPLTGNIQRPHYSSSIKVTSLLAMTDEMQSLLRSDRVFALQQKDEGNRFAKMSLRGHKLYLHHLQDGLLPSEDAKILPYNDVYSLADTKPTMCTFLSFGWNTKDQGRIYVRLDPAKTDRAKQFALLCTGLWGPTYANTKLLSVGNKGLPSEFIRGGDYEYNNGTGGASLLPGLKRGGEYWRRQVSGSVMAAGSWGDACSAQFIISTRNPGLTQRDDAIYGQVEGGLQVLNAAIKDVRITQVNVTDCGILIPL